MSFVSKVILKRRIQLVNHDFYFHNWFCYHISFFGSLIFHGKKLSAFGFFLRLKYELKLRELNDPYLIFLVAMMKVTPKILLRPMWIGGVTRGIPLPIIERKKFMFAVKWTLKLLRNNKRALRVSTLADLLINALYDKGEAIKKKHMVYAIAIENRDLIRYLK